MARLFGSDPLGTACNEEMLATMQAVRLSSKF